MLCKVALSRSGSRAAGSTSQCSISSRGSVSTGAGQGQEAPMESVSFSYSKISWDYTAIDSKTGAKGATSAAKWDIQTNSAT